MTFLYCFRMLSEDTLNMEETYNFSKKVNYFETTTNNYEAVQNELSSISSVITVILCSGATAADILLVVLMLSFKKLRCRTSCYVFHFAIFNCLYFVVTPPFFVMFEQKAFSSYYNSKFLCTLLQTERTCLSFCFLFAFGLCFQWLVSNFNSKLGRNFSRALKYLLYVLYIIGFITFFVVVALCVTEYSEIAIKIHDTIYFLALIFCTTANILSYKYHRGNEDDISRLQANLIVFSWIPSYVHKYLYKLSVNVSDENFFKWMLECLKVIFEWPGYLSAIGVVLIFCLEENSFEMLMTTTICQRNRVCNTESQSEYEEESTSIHGNETDTYGHADGIFSHLNHEYI